MSRDSDDRSDEMLVILSKAGDQDAFCTLFLHYKEEVYRCLMRVVRNDEIAKDLWQETYLRAWDHIRSLIEPSRFKPWLLAIARNLAIDWLRQNRREKDPLEKVGRSTPDLTDGDASFKSMIEREYILCILAEMEPRLRDVLLLNVNGYSQTEIAQRLGYAEATVPTYLSYARKQFRQLYHAMGHNDNGE